MYCFTKLDYIKYGFIGIACAYLMLYLFYNNFIISLVGSVSGISIISWMKAVRYKHYQHSVKKQFKEGLYALSTSIQVGKSMENAFELAIKDLSLLYDEKDFIMIHFKKIISKLAMNKPIESALYDFALTSNDEDIYNFVMIFITSKRAGGSVVEIMQSTSQVIHDKIEFLEHVRLLITNKKYEHGLMMIILPLMLVYFKLNNAEFLDVMYTTIPGRIVMTISLLLYMISFYIGYKIVSIEV